MSIVGDIHARLVGDVTLAGMLATYRGAPAVITTDDDGVMEDVEAPFVIVAGADVDDPYDAKDTDGRDRLIAVRVYADATGSVALVDSIAERVRALLHRQPAGLGDGSFVADCSGPITAPTDTAFYGRQLTLRLMSLPT